jgi:hypothetical protein
MKKNPKVECILNKEIIKGKHFALKRGYTISKGKKGSTNLGI